jgi:hypothetical protein
LNCGILTTANIRSHSTENCSHEVFNSHDQLFSYYESSMVVSHLELTDNYSRTSLSLSYKTLIWHTGNASIVVSLLKRRTSLLTWSCDPSPLLHHPSVYSCCLATNEARQCDTMHDSSQLGSAWRKHCFVYCCIIVRACFDVTVLAWRKYSTISTQILQVYNFCICTCNTQNYNFLIVTLFLPTVQLFTAKPTGSAFCITKHFSLQNWQNWHGTMEPQWKQVTSLYISRNRKWKFHFQFQCIHNENLLKSAYWLYMCVHM